MSEAEELARILPVIRSLRTAGARANLRRHHEVRSGAGRRGCGRYPMERRLRPVRARRAGDLRRARLRRGADAHARRAAHDADQPDLRCGGRGGQRLARRARGDGDGGGGRAGADLARSRDRLRQDGAAQPGASRGTGPPRGAGLPAPARRQPQGLHARRSRPWPRPPRIASADRSPSPSRPQRAGVAMVRVHDVRRDGAGARCRARDRGRVMPGLGAASSSSPDRTAGAERGSRRTSRRSPPSAAMPRRRSPRSPCRTPWASTTSTRSPPPSSRRRRGRCWRTSAPTRSRSACSADPMSSTRSSRCCASGRTSPLSSTRS